MRTKFNHLARLLAELTGSAEAFALTWLLFALWIAAGFKVGFADMLYQFIGSNAMSYVSLLLLILLQASQNHDTKAIHLKLDELLRAHADARNSLISAEKLADDELHLARQDVARIAKQQRGC
jgi:low affinity Fe/Cu permease